METQTEIDNRRHMETKTEKDRQRQISRDKHR